MTSSVVRRCCIIALTALTIFGIAAPAAWSSTGPTYETTARIRIAPAPPPILSDAHDTHKPMYDYESFKLTEAQRMTGQTVLKRAADEFRDRDLAIFNGSIDLLAALKEKVRAAQLVITPEKRTEYITLTMTGPHPKDAESVINAVIRAYMTVVHADQHSDSNRTLKVLDEQRRTLQGRITLQSQELSRLMDEVFTQKLDSRHAAILQTAAVLQQAVADTTLQRLSCQSRLATLEKPGGGIPAEDHAEKLSAHINSDPVVRALAERIVHYEVLLAEAHESEHAAIGKTLKALTTRLATSKSELAARFESDRHARLLAAARAQLEHTILYAKMLREELDACDALVKSSARKQLNVDDRKAELERTRKLYNQICDRISEIEIQQKQPPRISIAEFAHSIPLISHSTPSIDPPPPPTAPHSPAPSEHPRR